ncbi:MAG: hypothetical protein Kow0062_09890 [Acidobacteriota bacterium]
MIPWPRGLKLLAGTWLVVVLAAMPATAQEATAGVSVEVVLAGVSPDQARRLVAQLRCDGVDGPLVPFARSGLARPAMPTGCVSASIRVGSPSGESRLVSRLAAAEDIAEDASHGRPVVLHLPGLAWVRFGMHDATGTAITPFGRPILRGRDRSGQYLGVAFPELSEDLPPVALLPGRWTILGRFVSPGVEFLRFEGGNVVAGGKAVELAQGPAEVDIVISQRRSRVKLRVRAESRRKLSRLEACSSLPGEIASIRECQTCRPDPVCALSFERFPVHLELRDPSSRFRLEPSRLAVLSGEEPRDMEVRARELEAERVAGRVVSAASAAPVPGALIRASRTCPGGVQDLEPQVTDGSGGFSILCARGCSVTLHVSPRDGVHRDRIIRALSCDEPKEQLISLRCGAVVRGTVRNASGEPLSAVPLVLRKAGHHGEADRQTETNRSGAFAFRAVAPGAFIIEPLDDAMILLERGHSRRLPRIEPAGCGVAMLPDLQLVPAARICLSVTDAAGTPVELTDLAVYAADGPQDDKAVGQWRRDRETAEASVRMCTGRLHPGVYLLRIGTPWGAFAPQWWPAADGRDQAEPIELRIGETLELDPVRVTPTGQIRISPTTGESFDPDALTVELRPEPAARRVEAEAGASAPARESFGIVAEERLLRGGCFEEITVGLVPEGRWSIRLCTKNEANGARSDCHTVGPVVVTRGRTTVVEVPGAPVRHDE